MEVRGNPVEPDPVAPDDRNLQRVSLQNRQDFQHHHIRSDNQGVRCCALQQPLRGGAPLPQPGPASLHQAAIHLHESLNRVNIGVEFLEQSRINPRLHVPDKSNLPTFPLPYQVFNRVVNAAKKIEADLRHVRPVHLVADTDHRPMRRGNQVQQPFLTGADRHPSRRLGKRHGVPVEQMGLRIRKNMVENNPITTATEHLVRPFQNLAPERMEKCCRETGKNDFNHFSATGSVTRIRQDHSTDPPSPFHQSGRCQPIQRLVHRLDIDAELLRQLYRGRQYLPRSALRNTLLQFRQQFFLTRSEHSLSPSNFLFSLIPYSQVWIFTN